MNKNFYNTILSQTFSPCGKYLCAGDIYGDIWIFHLEKILNLVEYQSSDIRKPQLKFETGGLQVCSLVTTKKFLVSGTVGEISGWDWKTIMIANKTPKISWTIQIPTNRDSLEKTDVNVMVYDQSTDYLYAGCGDNNIYVFSLEDGKLVRKMEGHTDYIHSIHNNGTQLASASEDGSVRLWDLRDKTEIHQINPHTKDKVTRPQLGKWIGSVAINEDWLLCGGGPRLSIWHLRSLNMATVFPIEDNGIHTTHFYEDRIMAGGAGIQYQFYQLSYSGDIYAEISTSSTTVYSAIYQNNSQVLCLAGSSPKIDLCTNFGYRDQVLSLY